LRRSISLSFKVPPECPVDVIAIAAVFGGLLSLVFRFVEELQAIESPSRSGCLPIRPNCSAALAAASAIVPISGSASSPKDTSSTAPAVGQSSLGFHNSSCRHPPGPRPPAFRPSQLARSNRAIREPRPPIPLSSAGVPMCPNTPAHSDGFFSSGPCPATVGAGVRFRSAPYWPASTAKPGGRGQKPQALPPDSLSRNALGLIFS